MGPGLSTSMSTPQLSSYHRRNSNEPSTSSPEGFCKQCRAVFSGSYERRSGPHHDTVHSLQLSMLSDCYICCCIWNMIGTGDLTDSEPATKFEVTPCWHPESLQVEFKRVGLPTSAVASFLLFPQSPPEKCDEVESDISPLKISTSIGEGTNSRETWGLICNWLETCNPQTHPKCHPAQTTSVLPTRLLDLYHPGGVRLVSLFHTPGRAKYVTLSHSWGHARFLTLTKETSSQLRTGISESALPQSFRDAISVTRKLGVQFLWIDSLCIYQDDFSDWAKEAAHMADVYSGSYCNIAATAAKDSSQGFFYKSESYTATRRLAEARSISATWTSRESKNLIRPGDYLLCIKDFWLQGMTAQPLMKRGWVVQERMLAHRTIHFSQPQVFWECSHRIACELFPKRLPANAGVFDDLSLLWKQAHFKSSRKRLQEDRKDRPPLVSGLSYFFDDQPVDPWQALVEAFSVCKLTMERDKLPAMSGIARYMAREGTRGRYFAGLWENDFARQLLWAVVSKRSLIHQPIEYRAPSWSWAAIDGPISHFTIPRGEVTTAIIAVNTLDDGENVAQDDIRINLHWYVKMRAPLHLATVTPLNGKIETQHLIDVHSTGLKETDMIYWNTKSPPTGPTGVWILPVWYARADEWHPVVRGLVLKPMLTLGRGKYHRVGMFTMHPETEEDLNVIIRGSELIEEGNYEEYECKEDEGGWKLHSYTFTIL